ncbi:MAG TPA: hypothetical protein VMV29_15210 [Ktedonobacterales bacterium]|nr:hypothetical protein [Ktedonobacterales bacterium]
MPELDILARLLAAGLSQVIDQLMRQSLRGYVVFGGMALTILGAYYMAEKAARQVLPVPMSLVRVLGCGLVGAVSYSLLISLGFTPTITGVLIGACLGFGLQGALALALARMPSGENNPFAFRVARAIVGVIVGVLATLMLISIGIVYWLFTRLVLPLLHGILKVFVVVGMIVVFIVVTVVGIIFWEKLDRSAKRPDSEGRTVVVATAASPFNGKKSTYLWLVWAIILTGAVPDKYKHLFGEGATILLVFFFLGGCVAGLALLAAILVDVLFGRVVGAFSRPLLVSDSTGAEWLTTPINPAAYMLLFALVLGLIIGVVTAVVHKIGMLSASRFLVGFVAGLALGPFSGLIGAAGWVVTTVAVIVICLAIRWLAERAKERQALFGASLVSLGVLLCILPYLTPIR